MIHGQSIPLTHDCVMLGVSIEIAAQADGMASGFHSIIKGYKIVLQLYPNKLEFMEK